MASAKDVILHYKKKLERGVPEDKILEIFEKLNKVAISLDLLRETSIGKCVNNFKKTPGDVGERARLLVGTWKNAVKTPVNPPAKNNSQPEQQKSLKRSLYEAPNKYKNYADNSDEDRAANGEYSPRTNAHLPVLDGKKYLNHEDSEEADETEEIGNSYNPSSTVNDYKSYRKHKGSSDSGSPVKHKHSSKHSSVVDRNPKSERKKESSPKNKETSHHHSHQSKGSRGGTTSKAESGTPKSNNGEKKQKQHSSSSSSEKSKKKIKKGLDEFTNSVASFEACLGFNDEVPTKSSKSKTKPASSSSTSSQSNPVTKKYLQASSSSSSSSKRNVDDQSSYDPEHPEIQSTSYQYQPSKTETHKKRKTVEKQEPRVPEELNKKPKLEPLRVDILSTLPDIQPNYKPLRHNPSLFTDETVGLKKKSLSNEEAILFTSSRNEKTAVYAGRRHGGLGEVPSLFDSCIRILTENIDSLGYTGGVPYQLLKPVLEKCTPAQLYTFEDFNNYVIEETDELWLVHCQRDFKAKAPEEHESWRDLYLRLHDEREQRFKNITANISANMRKTVPVRTTKLAYVDSVAKPPRDVVRRQMANGTAVPNGFRMKGGPPSKATPRPIAGALNSAAAAAASQSSSAQLKKPKVAPLMQKTLKFMKQRFRR